MRVQLAIQGGGAKISALLAALEVLENLRKEQRIEVTRIAGTSAGAIAACLFAGKIPVSEVKAFLLGGIGRKLVDHFQPPSWWGFYQVGVNGKPFWNTAVLERYLSELFAKHDLVTIEDLERVGQMEVLVVAADLRDLRKITAPKSTTIVSALMDSAGLPFCFRTWNRGGGPVVVDGGLCENLPIGELQKNESDGPIVAISFKPSLSRAPSTLTQFSAALLNTAINNSMHRARSALAPDCIFEIQTSIDTFEFEKAVTHGLGDAYELVKLQTEKFFDDFIRKRSAPTTAIEGDPWTNKNPRVIDLMRGLGAVYFTQHAKDTFRYLDCVLELTAHSLEPDADLRQPDEMKYCAVFQPLEKPIQCMSVALMSSSDGFLGRTSWDLRDEHKNRIESIALPAINEKAPLDRELIHFFNPVIEPNTGTFRLVFKDEAAGLLAKFAKTGVDDLVIYPRRARGKVGRIRVILHVPSKCPGVVMLPKNQGPPGRAMTDKELAEFDAPVHFYTLGWIGEDVEGVSFGPDIRK